MPPIPNPQTVLPPPAPCEAEHDLIAAILLQASRDLRRTMPEDVRDSAARFWRGEEGTLAWFCELLGANVRQVQRRIVQRYPDVLAPRQLALDGRWSHERRSLDNIA